MVALGTFHVYIFKCSNFSINFFTASLYLYFLYSCDTKCSLVFFRLEFIGNYKSINVTIIIQLYFVYSFGAVKFCALYQA